MAPPTPTADLTARQRAVLDFIKAHAECEGAPPTLQQISDAFGFAQACAAHKHVQRLRQAGYLEVRPNQARGIRIVDTEPASRRARSKRTGPKPAEFKPDGLKFARSQARSQAIRREQLALSVLGQVAAGVPIGADIGSERMLLLDRALFSTTPDYLLQVKGDSMRDDGIFDGDLVAVKRSIEARNGQVVVARIDGEITIKRFESSRTRIRLLPRNPEYAPIEVPPGSDFAIEGLYCGLVRAG